MDALTALGETGPPERDAIRERHRYDRSIRTTPTPDLRYYLYDPDRQRKAVGFAIQNHGSPRVNPVGLERRGARGGYAFMFADRARETIHLAINDDVKLSGRFSHDNMFRELQSIGSVKGLFRQLNRLISANGTGIPPPR